MRPVNVCMCVCVCVKDREREREKREREKPNIIPLKRHLGRIIKTHNPSPLL